MRCTQTQLSTFNFNNQEIRVIIIDNEPWFIAADVCAVLEHTNTSVALLRLKVYEKQLVDPKQYLGSVSNQYISAISESGLYRLVLSSRKPQAELFQDWVVQEVLPTIRKTGRYSVSDFKIPTTYGEALLEAGRLALELEQTNATLEQVSATLEEQAPLIKLAETLTVKDVDAVLIGDLAKAYGVGRTTFFDMLRDIRFIMMMPSRLPYQRHVLAARAEVFRKERPHQPGIFDSVTVITARGQLYIAKKLKQLECAKLVESQLEAAYELVE
jgi:prophage antirepressor-like protein